MGMDRGSIGSNQSARIHRIIHRWKMGHFFNKVHFPKQSGDRKIQIQCHQTGTDGYTYGSTESAGTSDVIRILKRPRLRPSFLQQSSFSKVERRQKDTNSVPSDWNRRLHVWIDRIGWNVGRHQDSEASTIKAVISSTKFILTITCQAERQPEGDEAKRGLESQSQSLMMDRITFDLSLG